ncbi:hypothetical protein ABZS96_44200, partial [Streptomyces avermitilis]
GEGVLEADFRQSAVAGPAHAGDVQGLIDGALPARSEAMIQLAMTDLMARRLTDEATISWRDPIS